MAMSALRRGPDRAAAPPVGDIGDEGRPGRSPDSYATSSMLANQMVKRILYTLLMSITVQQKYRNTDRAGLDHARRAPGHWRVHRQSPGRRSGFETRPADPFRASRRDRLLPGSGLTIFGYPCYHDSPIRRSGQPIRSANSVRINF